MEGRRHGRGWGEVGDAGGCGARARWHVPASGGCRRGAGGKGWESHRVGPLRELFHVRLASGRRGVEGFMHGGFLVRTHRYHVCRRCDSQTALRTSLLRLGAVPLVHACAVQCSCCQYRCTGGVMKYTSVS